MKSAEQLINTGVINMMTRNVFGLIHIITAEMKWKSCIKEMD